VERPDAAPAGDVDHPPRESRDRLALLLAGGGGPCRRLVAERSGGEGVLAALAGQRGGARLAELAHRLAAVEAVELLERVAAIGWQWAVPGEAGYPPLLAQASDPPLGLFVRGRSSWDSVVAVVGSRRATVYGRQVARLLGQELAAAGVVVASGMARGVDAAAHQGALAAGWVTVAVWGTGPDRVYPAEHRRLAEAIAGQGAILTEYPPGTPPRPQHFPERNRILAGMAHAVVVVEAGARSGALITARLALEEGREVLAVPGSIFSELSTGPNALLRAGARPLLTVRDLLEVVPAVGRSEGRPGPELRGLLAWGEALTVDELAARAGVGVDQLQLRLLELELAGEVERRGDGRYALR
jgi:DNA processing protein